MTSDKTLRESIIESLEESRNNILDGNVNCIPLPFERYREDFPGIRKKFYYLVSGATKSSKTQITNYLFVMTPIFYYIDHPDQVVPKIFYFPLEETKEDIMLRIYAYIIYKLSNKRIVISPEDLESVDERKPLPQEVLDLMKSEEFIKLANVFEDRLEFVQDQKNPTGIYKTVKDYLDSVGTIQYVDKVIKYKDEFGELQVKTVKKVDKYIPNNPKEYVIYIVDHAGLLQQERGLSLKETIEKLSEYNKDLRNDYGAIPVLVQQQNSESTNLDAFKANKIRPVKDGLKDSKRTGEDCTVMLGITNPSSFELPNYLGYDITKFKSYFRVLEIVLARKGKANGLCPLFFNGAINCYEELPKPNETEKLNRIYSYIESLNKPIENKNNGMLFFNSIKNKIKLLINYKLK